MELSLYIVIGCLCALAFVARGYSQSNPREPGPLMEDVETMLKSIGVVVLIVGTLMVLGKWWHG